MESLGYIFFWLDEREDIIQINDLDSLPHEALLGSGHGANYLLIPKQSVNKGLVNELGYTKDLNWIY
jgi:hypothetical protein